MIFELKDDENYKGSGYALAVSKNGNIVDYKYLHEIHDDFYFEDTATLQSNLASLTADERVKPIIADYVEKGDIHIGMVSCFEFVEL